MGPVLCLEEYVVDPGSKVRLGDVDLWDTSGFTGGKRDGEEAIGSLIGKLDLLQELLYAKWKFSYLEYNERSDWEAYEDALERTSTERASLSVVPSNHPWFRDLLVSAVIVQSIQELKMKYPKLDPEKAGMAAGKVRP